MPSWHALILHTTSWTSVLSSFHLHFCYRWGTEPWYKAIRANLVNGTERSSKHTARFFFLSGSSFWHLLPAPVPRISTQSSLRMESLHLDVLFHIWSYLDPQTIMMYAQTAAFSAPFGTSLSSDRFVLRTLTYLSITP